MASALINKTCVVANDGDACVCGLERKAVLVQANIYFI